MKNVTFVITIFLLIILISSTPVLCQDSSAAAKSDSLQNSKTEFKNWQFKIGYSLNNKNVTNLEGSYLIQISQVFALSLDTRLYSFISFTPSLSTNQIKITNAISISLKGGLGVIALGPVAGLEAMTAEFAIAFRYKIANNYNFVLEYKRISKSSISEGFETFPPKHWIRKFPIEFLSFGIEF